MSKDESGFTPSELAELDTGTDETEAPETETEDTPEPETPSDTTPAPAAGTAKPGAAKPPAGYVPQESLHEARARIKEEKARADKYEATFQKLLERQGQPPAKPAEQIIPDPNVDPVGNLEARLRQAEQALQDARQNQDKRTQQEQQAGQTNELLNKYAASVRTFKRTANDFDAAYQFIADARDKELELLGYDDPSERANRLQYEEGLIVGRALHGGKDPAKILYDYAVSRGYKAPAAANDNKLERLAKGQQAARTLNGGKSPNDGEPSLNTLADLDGEEFDKMFEQMRKKKMLG